MLAAVRDRYGRPAEVVEVRELPLPTPAPDGLLVRVHAASVNRADLDLIYPKPGFSRAFLGITAPRIRRIGCDVAGVVEAIGAEVTRFRTGDRVFADLYSFGLGGFGEYVAAPERAFLRIPDAMSTEDASTYPHAAVLAIQGLRRRDGRTPARGDRVLIDGASGNVGPFAVQIAKAFGAHVTGTASPAKLEFVRSLGADRVLDYTTTDYTRTGERFDWILDVDGHHSILEARRALRAGGTYLTLGGSGRRIVAALAAGPVAGRATGKHLGLMFWWKPFHAPDVERLGELYAARAVRPAIDRRYPLLQVVEALRYVDEGRARGKVVVTTLDGPIGPSAVDASPSRERSPPRRRAHADGRARDRRPRALDRVPHRHLADGLRGVPARHGGGADAA